MRYVLLASVLAAASAALCGDGTTCRPASCGTGRVIDPCDGLCRPELDAYRCMDGSDVNRRVSLRVLPGGATASSEVVSARFSISQSLTDGGFSVEYHAYMNYAAGTTPTASCGWVYPIKYGTFGIGLSGWGEGSLVVRSNAGAEAATSAADPNTAFRWRRILLRIPAAAAGATFTATAYVDGIAAGSWTGTAPAAGARYLEVVSKSPSTCGTAVFGDVAVFSGASRGPNATFSTADATLAAYYAMGDADGNPRCAGLRCSEVVFATGAATYPSLGWLRIPLGRVSAAGAVLGPKPRTPYVNLACSPDRLGFDGQTGLDSCGICGGNGAPCPARPAFDAAIGDPGCNASAPLRDACGTCSAVGVRPGCAPRNCTECAVPGQCVIDPCDGTCRWEGAAYACFLANRTSPAYRADHGLAIGTGDVARILLDASIANGAGFTFDTWFYARYVAGSVGNVGLFQYGSFQLLYSTSYVGGQGQLYASSNRGTAYFQNPDRRAFGVDPTTAQMTQYRWRHLVIVVPPGTVGAKFVPRVYMDGYRMRPTDDPTNGMEGTRSGDGTVVNLGDFTASITGTESDFKMMYGDVAVWSGALSEADATALSASGSTFSKPPAAYFPLAQRVGAPLCAGAACGVGSRAGRMEIARAFWAPIVIGAVGPTGIPLPARPRSPAIYPTCYGYSILSNETGIVPGCGTCMHATDPSACPIAPPVPATVDACGLLGGANRTCDSAVACAGPGVIRDRCGVCGGNGTSCLPARCSGCGAEGQCVVDPCDSTCKWERLAYACLDDRVNASDYRTAAGRMWDSGQSNWNFDSYSTAGFDIDEDLMRKGFAMDFYGASMSSVSNTAWSFFGFGGIRFLWRMDYYGRIYLNGANSVLDTAASVNGDGFLDNPDPTRNSTLFGVNSYASLFSYRWRHIVVYIPGGAPGTAFNASIYVDGWPILPRAACAQTTCRITGTRPASSPRIEIGRYNHQNAPNQPEIYVGDIAILRGNYSDADLAALSVVNYTTTPPVDGDPRAPYAYYPFSWRFGSFGPVRCVGVGCSRVTPKWAYYGYDYTARIGGSEASDWGKLTLKPRHWPAVQSCIGFGTNYGFSTGVGACNVCGAAASSGPCLDCAGVPGGSAVHDPVRRTCDGVCQVGAFDACGVCGGDGSTCTDAGCPTGQRRNRCGTCVPYASASANVTCPASLPLSCTGCGASPCVVDPCDSICKWERLAYNCSMLKTDARGDIATRLILSYGLNRWNSRQDRLRFRLDQQLVVGGFAFETSILLRNNYGGYRFIPFTFGDYYQLHVRPSDYFISHFLYERGGSRLNGAGWYDRWAYDESRPITDPYFRLVSAQTRWCRIVVYVPPGPLGSTFEPRVFIDGARAHIRQEQNTNLNQPSMPLRPSTAPYEGWIGIRYDSTVYQTRLLDIADVAVWEGTFTDAELRNMSLGTFGDPDDRNPRLGTYWTPVVDPDDNYTRIACAGKRCATSALYDPERSTTRSPPWDWPLVEATNDLQAPRPRTPFVGRTCDSQFSVRPSASQHDARVGACGFCNGGDAPGAACADCMGVAGGSASYSASARPACSGSCPANTARDACGMCSSAGLPTPPFFNSVAGWYDASSWFASNQSWVDRSPYGRHVNATLVRGQPYVVDDYGTAALAGDLGDGVRIPTAVLGPAPAATANYTVVTFTRYRANGPYRRIMDSVTSNWLFGQYSGLIGVCHNSPWKTSSSDSIPGQTTDWVLSVDRPASYKANGIYRNTSTTRFGSDQLAVNHGSYASTESSRWAAALILVYSRELSDTEVLAVEAWARNNYNVSAGAHFPCADAFCPPNSRRDRCGNCAPEASVTGSETCSSTTPRRCVGCGAFPCVVDPCTGGCVWEPLAHNCSAFKVDRNAGVVSKYTMGPTKMSRVLTNEYRMKRAYLRLDGQLIRTGFAFDITFLQRWVYSSHNVTGNLPHEFKSTVLGFWNYEFDARHYEGAMTIWQDGAERGALFDSTASLDYASMTNGAWPSYGFRASNSTWNRLVVYVPPGEPGTPYEPRVFANGRRLRLPVRAFLDSRVFYNRPTRPGLSPTFSAWFGTGAPNWAWGDINREYYSTPPYDLGHVGVWEGAFTDAELTSISAGGFDSSMDDRNSRLSSYFAAGATEHPDFRTIICSGRRCGTNSLYAVNDGTTNPSLSTSSMNHFFNVLVDAPVQRPTPPVIGATCDGAFSLRPTGSPPDPRLDSCGRCLGSSSNRPCADCTGTPGGSAAYANGTCSSSDCPSGFARDGCGECVRTYAQGALPPRAERLLGWYDGSSWNGTAWLDRSGNARHGTVVRGTPKTAVEGGVTVLVGETTDGVRLPTSFMGFQTVTGVSTPPYTLFFLTRCREPGPCERIIDTTTNTAPATDWFVGHWGRKAGIAYHANTWITTSTDSPVYLHDWVLGADRNSSIRVNGVFTNVTSTVYSSGQVTVNHGWRAAASAEMSRWAAALIMAYDYTLTDDEILEVEAWIRSNYNVSTVAADSAIRACADAGCGTTRKRDACGTCAAGAAPELAACAPSVVARRRCFGCGAAVCVIDPCDNVCRWERLAYNCAALRTNLAAPNYTMGPVRLGYNEGWRARSTLRLDPQLPRAGFVFDAHILVRWLGSWHMTSGNLDTGTQGIVAHFNGFELDFRMSDGVLQVVVDGAERGLLKAALGEPNAALRLGVWERITIYFPPLFDGGAQINPRVFLNGRRLYWAPGWWLDTAVPARGLAYRRTGSYSGWNELYIGTKSTSWGDSMNPIAARRPYEVADIAVWEGVYSDDDLVAMNVTTTVDDRNTRLAAYFTPLGTDVGAGSAIACAGKRCANTTLTVTYGWNVSYSGTAPKPRVPAIGRACDGNYTVRPDAASLDARVGACNACGAPPATPSTQCPDCTGTPGGSAVYDEPSRSCAPRCDPGLALDGCGSCSVDPLAAVASTLPPYFLGVQGWYDGSSWTSTAWNDKSYYARHATNIRGTPKNDTENGVPVVVGESGDGYRFPSTVFNGYSGMPYTLFTLTRYRNPGPYGRIFDSTVCNHIVGHHGGRVGVIHKNQDWITIYRDPASSRIPDPSVGLEEWILSTDRPLSYRVWGTNRTQVGYNGATFPPANANLGMNWGCSSEWSRWSSALVLVYNYVLTDLEVTAVEAWIRATYRVSPPSVAPIAPPTCADLGCPPNQRRNACGVCGAWATGAPCAAQLPANCTGCGAVPCVIDPCDGACKWERVAYSCISGRVNVNDGRWNQTLGFAPDATASPLMKIRAIVNLDPQLAVSGFAYEANLLLRWVEPTIDPSSDVVLYAYGTFEVVVSARTGELGVRISGQRFPLVNGTATAAWAPNVWRRLVVHASGGAPDGAMVARVYSDGFRLDVNVTDANAIPGAPGSDQHSIYRVPAPRRGGVGESSVYLGNRFAAGGRSDRVLEVADIAIWEGAMTDPQLLALSASGGSIDDRTTTLAAYLPPLGRSSDNLNPTWCVGRRCSNTTLNGFGVDVFTTWNGAPGKPRLPNIVRTCRGGLSARPLWAGDNGLDACGICGGPGAPCYDCAGVADGTATFDPVTRRCSSCAVGVSKDACGVCGGDNTTCTDSGCLGGLRRDRCGVCGGSGTACLPQRCYACNTSRCVVDACDGACRSESSPNLNACLAPRASALVPSYSFGIGCLWNTPTDLNYASIMIDAGMWRTGFAYEFRVYLRDSFNFNGGRLIPFMFGTYGTAYAWYRFFFDINANSISYSINPTASTATDITFLNPDGTRFGGDPLVAAVGTYRWRHVVIYVPPGVPGTYFLPRVYIDGKAMQARFTGIPPASLNDGVLRPSFDTKIYMAAAKSGAGNNPCVRAVAMYSEISIWNGTVPDATLLLMSDPSYSRSYADTQLAAAYPLAQSTGRPMCLGVRCAIHTFTIEREAEWIGWNAVDDVATVSSQGGTLGSRPMRSGTLTRSCHPYLEIGPASGSIDTCAVCGGKGIGCPSPALPVTYPASCVSALGNATLLAPAPAGFTPASLPSMVLWLDAQNTSTMTMDRDGYLSSWATLPVSTLPRPIFNQWVGNPRYREKHMWGRPAVDFRGTLGMVSYNVPIASSYTVAIVAQIGSIAGWGSFFQLGARDSEINIRRYGGETNLCFGTVSQTECNSVKLPYSTETPTIIIARMLNGKFKNFTVATAAGISRVAYTSPSTISPTSVRTLYLGRSDNNEYSESYIGEVVAYSYWASEAEEAALISYLGAKWGLNTSNDACGVCGGDHRTCTDGVCPPGQLRDTCLVCNGGNASCLPGRCTGCGAPDAECIVDPCDGVCKWERSAYACLRAAAGATTGIPAPQGMMVIRSNNQPNVRAEHMRWYIDPDMRKKGLAFDTYMMISMTTRPAAYSGVDYGFTDIFRYNGYILRLYANYPYQALYFCEDDAWCAPAVRPTRDADAWGADPTTINLMPMRWRHVVVYVPGGTWGSAVYPTLYIDGEKIVYNVSSSNRGALMRGIHNDDNVRYHSAFSTLSYPWHTAMADLALWEGEFSDAELRVMSASGGAGRTISTSDPMLGAYYSYASMYADTSCVGRRCHAPGASSHTLSTGEIQRVESWYVSSNGVAPGPPPRRIRLARTCHSQASSAGRFAIAPDIGVDACGKCLGSETNPANCRDCAGTVNGPAVVDSKGACGGDGTGTGACPPTIASVGNPSFDPNSISGLQMLVRLDAQNASLIARPGYDNRISTWTNSAPSGPVTTFTANNANPLWVPNLINGLPGVDFSNQAGFTSAAFARPLNATIVVVAQVPSDQPTCDYGAYFQHMGYDEFHIRRRCDVGSKIEARAQMVWTPEALLPIPLGSPFLIVFRVYDGKRFDLSVSAAATGTRRSNITYGTQAVPAQGSAVMYVGRTSVSQNLYGHIGEVVYYSGAATDAQEAALIAYMATKWKMDPVRDVCGVCNGDGTSCADIGCSAGRKRDVCGVCGGDGMSCAPRACYDCASPPCAVDYCTGACIPRSALGRCSLPNLTPGSEYAVMRIPQNGNNGNPSWTASTMGRFWLDPDAARYRGFVADFYASNVAFKSGVNGWTMLFKYGTFQLVVNRNSLGMLHFISDVTSWNQIFESNATAGRSGWSSAVVLGYGAWNHLVVVVPPGVWGGKFEPQVYLDGRNLQARWYYPYGFTSTRPSSASVAYIEVGSCSQYDWTAALSDLAIWDGVPANPQAAMALSRTDAWAAGSAGPAAYFSAVDRTGAVPACAGTRCGVYKFEDLSGGGFAPVWLSNVTRILDVSGVELAYQGNYTSPYGRRPRLPALYRQCTGDLGFDPAGGVDACGQCRPGAVPAPCDQPLPTVAPSSGPLDRCGVRGGDGSSCTPALELGELALPADLLTRRAWSVDFWIRRFGGPERVVLFSTAANITWNSNGRNGLRRGFALRTRLHTQVGCSGRTTFHNGVTSGGTELYGCYDDCDVGTAGQQEGYGGSTWCPQDQPRFDFRGSWTHLAISYDEDLRSMRVFANGSMVLNATAYSVPWNSWQSRIEPLHNASVGSIPVIGLYAPIAETLYVAAPSIPLRAHVANVRGWGRAFGAADAARWMASADRDPDQLFWYVPRFVAASPIATPAFDPAALSGLIAWYDPSVSSTVARGGDSRVTSWYANAGGSAPRLDAVSPAATYSPLYVASGINGRPAVDFSGARGLYSPVSVLAAAEVTVALVVRPNAATIGNWGVLFQHGSYDTDLSLRSFSNEPRFEGKTGNVQGALQTYQVGVPMVLVLRISGNGRVMDHSATIAHGASFYTNRSRIIAPAATTALASGVRTIYVGRSNAGHNGEAILGDILYYARALTDDEEALTIRFLASKYGIGGAASPTAGTAAKPSTYVVDETGRGNHVQLTDSGTVRAAALERFAAIPADLSGVLRLAPDASAERTDPLGRGECTRAAPAPAAPSLLPKTFRVQQGSSEAVVAIGAGTSIRSCSFSVAFRSASGHGNAIPATVAAVFLPWQLRLDGDPLGTGASFRYETTGAYVRVTQGATNTDGCWNGATCPGTATAGAWNHFVVVVSPSAVTVYVNGTQRATAAIASPPSCSSTPLLVLRSGNHPSSWVEAIDVRAWARPITASEAAALVTNGTAPGAPDWRAPLLLPAVTEVPATSNATQIHVHPLRGGLVTIPAGPTPDGSNSTCDATYAFFASMTAWCQYWVDGADFAPWRLRFGDANGLEALHYHSASGRPRVRFNNTANPSFFSETLYAQAASSCSGYFDWNVQSNRGQWLEIHVTVSNRAVAYYANGTLQASSTVPVTSPSCTAAPTLVLSAGDTWFKNSVVRGVRYWKGARSASEIAARDSLPPPDYAYVPDLPPRRLPPALAGWPSVFLGSDIPAYPGVWVDRSSDPVVAAALADAPAPACLDARCRLELARAAGPLPTFCDSTVDPCTSGGPCGDPGCARGVFRDRCGVCGGDNSTCANTCVGCPSGKCLVDPCDGSCKDASATILCTPDKALDLAAGGEWYGAVLPASGSTTTYSSAARAAIDPAAAAAGFTVDLFFSVEETVEVSDACGVSVLVRYGGISVAVDRGTAAAPTSPGAYPYSLVIRGCPWCTWIPLSDAGELRWEPEAAAAFVSRRARWRHLVVTLSPPNANGTVIPRVFQDGAAMTPWLASGAIAVNGTAPPSDDRYVEFGSASACSPVRIGDVAFWYGTLVGDAAVAASWHASAPPATSPLAGADIAYYALSEKASGIPACAGPRCPAFRFTSFNLPRERLTATLDSSLGPKPRRERVIGSCFTYGGVGSFVGASSCGICGGNETLCFGDNGCPIPRGGSAPARDACGACGGNCTSARVAFAVMDDSTGSPLLQVLANGTLVVYGNLEAAPSNAPYLFRVYNRTTGATYLSVQSDGTIVLPPPGPAGSSDPLFVVRDDATGFVLLGVSSEGALLQAPALGPGGVPGCACLATSPTP